MKPLLHAKVSVHKFGGKVEDYIQLHNWMDSTKAHLPDMRHRMILHNAWVIFTGEQIFGTYFKNSDDKDISVRDVLEQHVLDDLGHIPTLEQCLRDLPAEPWMGSAVRGTPMKMKISDINRYKIEIVD